MPMVCEQVHDACSGKLQLGSGRLRASVRHTDATLSLAQVAAVASPAVAKESRDGAAVSLPVRHGFNSAPTATR